MYQKRWDTFLKKWILERVEGGGKVHWVASYPDEAMINQIISVLNERRIDVI